MVEDTDVDAGAAEVLSFVDFVAQRSSIQEADLQQLLSLPKFQAATLAFGSGLVPFAYAVLFCWKDASEKLPHLTPARLADVVYNAALRMDLEPTDDQYIAIDRVQLRSQFPQLLTRPDHSRLREVRKQQIDEIGDFLTDYHWRANDLSTLRMQAQKDYAEYWFKQSPGRIAPLLSDRKFLAALDAYREGALSYVALLQKLYGPKGRVLFPELGFYLSRLVLSEMAKAVSRGDIVLPEGLRSEFPWLYEFFNPEAFGHKLTD